MKKTTAEKFEEYFQEWLDEIQKPEIMVSSNSADYVDNEPYKKIIKLGKPSLPLVMDKIAQGYFFLNHAISEITGKKISEIISGGMKPTSQQEISRLWLTWWKKQKQTDVVDFSVGTGQFIATWTKLFDEAHRHPNEFTHKRFLNLPFISDFETLENEESLSLITKIKHNLDKYILDLSLVGPSAHVKTSVHWIPGIALIYAITNPNFPMDMMLKTSGILSTTASLDTKKLHKQKYILLEETKD